jgi:hypothetical protein
MGDRSYKLQLEKNITLASQPIEIAFSHHTPDLAIVTSNGTLQSLDALSSLPVFTVPPLS